MTISRCLRHKYNKYSWESKKSIMTHMNEIYVPSNECKTKAKSWYLLFIFMFDLAQCVVSTRSFLMCCTNSVVSFRCYYVTFLRILTYVTVNCSLVVFTIWVTNEKTHKMLNTYGLHLGIWNTACLKIMNITIDEK